MKPISFLTWLSNAANSVPFQIQEEYPNQSLTAYELSSAKKGWGDDRTLYCPKIQIHLYLGYYVRQSMAFIKNILLFISF